jgi:hypothetical protein
MVSKWTIVDKREDSTNLCPENLVDLNFRTPLHYAAERLEAVKFILGYTGINVDLDDNKTQKPVDLALDNIYDVYSVFLGGFWT